MNAMTTLSKLMLLLVALVVLVGSSLEASSSAESAPVKEAADEQRASVQRAALTRFLFSRLPSDTQAQLKAAYGYKRSSSGLDALTGVIIGKRSPLELEPIFGHQYNMRSAPKLYEMRWAPVDAFEAEAM